MKSELVVRRSLSVAGAILLSLVLAGQSMAATWNPKVRLTSSSNGMGFGLVTLGTSTAVAGYIDTHGAGIYIRRSTSSGATWSARLKLAAHVTWGAIAGVGSSVDVVWTEDTDFNQDSSIRYARSGDGGMSFGAPVELAAVSDPAGGAGLVPGVARGPGGIVAVVWHEHPADLIRVRISNDGGATFGGVQTLATLSSGYFRPPMVAIGNGVIYVAYLATETSIELRRSLDGGANWTAAVQLASDVSYQQNIYAMSLTASRSHAYLAYSAENGSSRWVRYMRTIDKGSTWSPVADLSSPSGTASYKPVISLKGSVVRVAFTTCGNSSCTSSRVSYRQSSNGTTWTTVETASHSGPSWAEAKGVGYAGRIIVLYDAERYRSVYDYNSDVFVRTR